MDCRELLALNDHLSGEWLRLCLPRSREEPDPVVLLVSETLAWRFGLLLMLVMVPARTFDTDLDGLRKQDLLHCVGLDSIGILVAQGSQDSEPVGHLIPGIQVESVQVSLPQKARSQFGALTDLLMPRLAKAGEDLGQQSSHEEIALPQFVLELHFRHPMGGQPFFWDSPGPIDVSVG